MVPRHRAIEVEGEPITSEEDNVTHAVIELQALHHTSNGSQGGSV